MQDLLGLGSEARMNVPGTTAGNWRWRFDWADIPADFAQRYATLAATHRHSVVQQSGSRRLPEWLPGDLEDRPPEVAAEVDPFLLGHGGGNGDVDEMVMLKTDEHAGLTGHASVDGVPGHLIA